jgi:5-formyltetrahydrofolate cyclo-ligase
LLVEAGLIGTDTVLVTTVHPLQVLDEAPPETTHDLRLDLRRRFAPLGSVWQDPGS